MKEIEDAITEIGVTLNLGETMNMGNFQSLKVEYGCTVSVNKDLLGGRPLEAAQDRIKVMVRENYRKVRATAIEDFKNNN